MTLFNAFASERHHIAASSLIFVTNMFKVIEWFRKTLAFRSSKITHETSMAKEDIAFLASPLLWMTSIHHALTVRKTCQS
jgi:hypothetical protein